MHLLQDNDSGHNEPIYEEFIKDAQDDKEDEEGNKQDHLRRNLSVKSKQSTKGSHWKAQTLPRPSRAQTPPAQPPPYSAQPATSMVLLHVHNGRANIVVP
jgi:hypothetical protein